MLSGSCKQSVMDIAMEAKQVYNTFTTIFSVAKYNMEVDEQFIQNIYVTFRISITVDQLIKVAEMLKKRMEPLLEENANCSILTTVWEYIKKRFPHHYLTDQRGKFEKMIKDNLEAQSAPKTSDALKIADIVIAKVLAIGLNNIEENSTNDSSSMEILEFPLAAPEEGKFHDFECPGINHYYVATSQYYKMLLQPLHIPFPKPIQNKPNSVQSVEHISNPKTVENYNAKKEVGKVNRENKVREMLLFHGTDAANIDSILEEGFNINFNPKHKSKLQLYGRGIYVAEHPEMAFHYGNIILVSKVGNSPFLFLLKAIQLLLFQVVPGKVQKIELLHPVAPGQEMEDIPNAFDSREVLIGRSQPSPFFVIKGMDQVLPYCVINFTRGLPPSRPCLLYTSDAADD